MNERAAAGAPIISAKINSVPTTGTVVVVTSATTTRNARSTRKVAMPRASATSGSSDESISGRYRIVIAPTEAIASTTVGVSWALLTPRISPKSREKVSDAYSLLRLTNSAPSPSIVTSVSAVATS